MGRPPHHVRHAAAGAVVGAAVADAVAGTWENAGRIVPAVLGGRGELDTGWSDVTARTLAVAEELVRAAPVPFDLAATSAHVAAIAARGEPTMPLLVDADAADCYGTVSTLLDAPEHRDELPCFESMLHDAWESGGAGAVRALGAVAGARCGVSAIPSRWTTYVFGPGPRRIHRTRDLLRLAERLLGVDRPLPPDPPRRLGPREVADGVHAANMFGVAPFCRDHPEGAVVSLHPVDDRLDAHPVRRWFAVEDVAARAANPRLGEVLDEVLDTIAAFRAEGREVLVHCHHGVSRTGLVLRAWLMRTEGLDEELATLEVSARWPRLSLANDRFTRELRRRC